MKISRIMKAGVKYLFDSNYRFMFNASRGKYDTMPDEEYLCRLYKCKMGVELNLEAPRTFNEKLQWLKLYYRKPVFTQMVDKYQAREFVRDKVGEEYLVPLLACWNTPEEIDVSELPDQFVLKTNHGCGGMIICKDKSRFDVKKAKRIMSSSFYKNYYLTVREWPYKNVKPLVIAEKYMQDGDTQNLKVYKVFNFSGKPFLIQTITNDKTEDETIDYFDTNWNRLNIRQNYPNSDILPKRPKTLEKILELSEKCSEGMPFLRTDWYEVNGQVFFSEFTLYTDAGMEPYHPDEWDLRMGDLLILPKVYKG